MGVPGQEALGCLGQNASSWVSCSRCEEATPSLRPSWSAVSQDHWALGPRRQGELCQHVATGVPGPFGAKDGAES